MILFWMLACLWLIVRQWPAISTMTLPDSDDNLRLMEVRDWIAGQGWFDLRQYRLAPPAGADIHWSRLVDLPLAGMILVLRALFGQPLAEQISVAIVPLLTLLVAMLLVTRIVRVAIAPRAWWWGPAMLLMATPAVGMMTPLRIDHHGWQIIALFALAWGLIHPISRNGGLIAGSAIAASLTIGVEMMPYLALGAALAAIDWLIDPAARERLRWLAGTAAGGVLIALLLFVAPPARLGAYCDALSFAYALPILLGGGAIVLATLFPGKARITRFGLLGGSALIAAAGLAGGGAHCLIDPYSAVDPAARALWLDIVAEALPLHAQAPDVALAILVLPLIGLAGCGFMLVRNRGNTPRIRAWAVLAILALASIALTFASTRAGVAAQALAVPGAAALGHAGWTWLTKQPSFLVRVFGSVLLFMLVSGLIPRVAIAIALATPSTPRDETIATANAACLSPTAIARLDAAPPGIVLGLIDTTPALLAHSHHSGVAGPYHRNGAAIAAVMHAWAGDDATARATIRRYNIRYIMLCGSPSEGAFYRKRGPRGLYARVSRGSIPGWLRPLPITASPWRIWQVVD